MGKEQYRLPVCKNPEKKGRELLPVIRRSLFALALVCATIAAYNFEQTSPPSDKPPIVYAQADSPKSPILVSDTEEFSRLLQTAKEKGLLGNPTKAAKPESQETFETRSVGPYTLTKIEGNWTDERINVLILGQGFLSDTDFLPYAVAVKDQLFYYKPFFENKDKFSIYSLSIKNPSVRCGPDLPCDYKSVRESVKRTVDQVTDSFKLHLEETIVVEKNPSFSGWAYLDADSRPDPYTFAYVTSGALDYDLVAAHEFGHSFGNLIDEYTHLSLYPAPDTFINCLPQKTLAEKWKDIPGQPGAKHLGCGDFINGFRDADNDVMTYPGLNSVFGPVDSYQLGNFIGQGKSRYVLQALYRLFFPTTAGSGK